MSRLGRETRHGTARGGRRAVVLAALVAVCRWQGTAAVEPAAGEAAEPVAGIVEFIRVRVPAGRLQDVPVDAERHVPMSVAEFDRALARLGPAAARADQPVSLPAAARYELRPDATGGLVGQLVIDVDDAAPGRFLRLGAVRSSGGVVRTGRGAGAAVVFGLPDGGTALATPEAGTYSCQIACPPAVTGGGRVHLPLVGSLTTTILLENVPARSRPLVSASVGSPIVRRIDAGETSSAWRIDVGAAAAVDIEIVDGDRPAPRVAIWTRASVVGGAVAVTTQVVPAGSWHGGELVLTKSPTLRPTAVWVADVDDAVGWRETDEGRELRIRVPPAAESRSTPLLVAAIGPAPLGRDWAVPTFAVNASAWGGGGIVLTVDPAVVVEDVAASGAGYRMVTPEIAARWPLPPAAPADDGEPSARMHFELQQAAGAPQVVLRPRAARFDVARVTTVEMTRERVVGQAACDVRVVGGEAFGIEGRIMQGWVIDSIEAVEWDGGRDEDQAGRQRGSAAERRVLEWTEPKPTRAGVRPLRIVLDAAATPSRGIGLRITGHRLSVPFDTGFETGDMDMVRLVGESADMSVVDFRPAPEALVEVGGTPLGLFDVPERLVPLVEETAARGRIRGGEQAASRRAVLVRRRPPLDADVSIEVAVREEVVTQTFRFACQTASAPLDSFVVHFSEPMGSELAWELVSPAGGGLVARRVEATDPGATGPRDRGPGESWLVELSPAVVGRVRVRAVREVPVMAAVPLPLAWVEAATRPGGTVLVRGEGTVRPTVRNRRLREVPPSAEAPAGAVAEFAYFETDRRANPGPAAAEVLAPQPDAESRAWAWHEESIVWCHDSGATEIETRFDIENHGRDAVTLQPLAGRRLREVLIDGRPLDLPAIDAAGSLRVPLPTGTARFTLQIRALAEHVPRLGCWWIETSSCTLDLPVLDRRLRLLLPPELEAVTVGGRHREVAAPARDWRERLFALSPVRTAEAAPAAGAAGSLAVGFRSRWFVPTTGAADAVGIGIVRRRLLDAVAIVSAWLALVAVSFAARRSVAASVALSAGAAVVALWTPAPFHIVTRVAWWACLAGTVVAARSRGWPRRPVVAAVVAAVACCPVAALQAADESAPLRVLVVPGDDGDNVLVPERLFRLLAATAADEDVGFRIIACRIRVDVAAADAPWRVELDVDADPGGRVVLDQRLCAARWLAAAADPAAVRVTRAADDQVARLAALEGGRLTVRLALRPAVERRGDVEFIAACLPPAARAVVEFVDGTGRAVQPVEDALQCELARRAGPFLRAAATDGACDVSGAAAVRLVRPADGSDRLVGGGLRGVRTINEVTWGLDACRLQATFEIDPGAGISRSFVVLAPAAFVPRAPEPEAEHTIVPLGAGRHLVELRRPRRGVDRVRLDFQSMLADPVGTFTVPEARLEAAVSDMLEVRLNAAADLDIDVEPPAAALPANTADGEPPRSGWAWRTERADGKPVAGSGARLSVRRKLQQVRATQRLGVEFTADGVRLQLRAKLDASTTPLASVVVDVPRGFSATRVAVFEDEVLEGGAAGRGPLDIEWKPGDDGLAIVVQQPRAGRFRLEVDASRTKPPARRGPLPLLRAVLAGGAPLAVEWWQADDGAGGVRHTAEVTAAGPAPEYELVTSTLPAVEPPAVELPEAALPAAGAQPRGVLLSRVHVALDDAGRLRGIARFDLLTAAGNVRLRLPARTRLLDVLVDGREVQAVPEGPEAWLVRLHDSLWPRSVSVVFGADVGPRGRAGQVRLAAPTIDGLDVRDVLWTIDPAPGAMVTLVDSARQLDAAAWQARVRDAEALVVDAFGPVIAATPEPIRERYRSFAATLAAGPASPLEASWDDAIPLPDGSGGGRVHGLAAGDGTIACRIDRVVDESLPQRVVVTGALVAAICLARFVATGRRRAGVAG